MPTGAPEPVAGRAPTAEQAPTEEVLVRRAGHLGHLVLNRPRALNALTGDMIAVVRQQLEAWREDDSVAAVLLTGAGERGLCAGGDLRAIHGALAAGRSEDGDAVFSAEYGMNAMIADFPKPYVAVMDGIVLGGGLGISAHGSHRIVTERSRLGMPEAGIGFFPDVGIAHLLARAPFRAGVHLALTGEHITGADAIALGLADHYVPSAQLETLARALETDDADSAIAAVAVEPPPALLLEHRDWIESCYAAGTASEIVAALQAVGAADGEGASRAEGDAQSTGGQPAAEVALGESGHPAAEGALGEGGHPAAEAARRILAGSPTSVSVALAHVRDAADRSLHEVLRTDFRLSSRLMRAPDFAEGVRAVLLDKDNSPRWDPAALEDVTDEAVEALLAPLPDGDLRLPDAGLRGRVVAK